jgi:predicted N-acyltransferase
VSIDAVDTIDRVDAAEWDGLCADHGYARHRWLRLAEAVMAGQRARYLLVRRDGRLVAAAAATIEHRLQDPRLDARLGWIVRRAPYLLVGVPLMAVPGLLAGDDPAGHGALLAAIRDHARRERFAFRVIDNLPAEHPAWRAQRDHVRLGWLPGTRLDIVWPSYEDYLAALPRKKRQEIRRGERRAAAEDIAVAPWTPAADEAPVLDRLVGDVLRRHGDIHELAPDLFARAAAILGDDLTVLAVRRRDRLAGCVALLREGEDLAAKWIGRDYAQTGGTAAYHAIVAGCVRTAIGLGVRRLHLGAAAYDTKRQFGVSLEPRGRLFATRSRALDRCLRGVRDRLGGRA